MKNAKRTVKILTKNKYLYQKLSLELDCEEFIITDSKAEITLCDIDTEASRDGAILMSYNDNSANITLPLRLGELRTLLLKNVSSTLSLIENERCALLFGEKIKLTELEYALLSLLYHRKDYVSREEILDTVWHGVADSGIVNVYIHYLREKLEKNGEKIILSSRKAGYRISETYLGGCENA